MAQLCSPAFCERHLIFFLIQICMQQEKKNGQEKLTLKCISVRENNIDISDKSN